LLRRPVEGRLAKYGPLRAQAELDKQTGDASQKAKRNVTRLALEEQNKQKRVAELLASFNKSYRDAKYKEAYQFASLAHEMDPDNAVATTAMITSKTMIRKQFHESNKDERERFFFEEIERSEQVGPAANMEQPVIFNRDRSELAKKRKPYGM